MSAGQRADEYPRFAVTVAIVLLFVSLALLVFFADHLAHSLQVDYILRVAERSTLTVIRELVSAENCVTVSDQHPSARQPSSSPFPAGPA